MLAQNHMLVFNVIFCFTNNISCCLLSIYAKCQCFTFNFLTFSHREKQYQEKESPKRCLRKTKTDMSDKSMFRTLRMNTHRRKDFCQSMVTLKIWLRLYKIKKQKNWTENRNKIKIQNPHRQWRICLWRRR